VPESVDHSLSASVASPDDVLTAEEVALLLRMTQAWVYSETRQDRIPHMRFGRRFRYRRSAIDAWMRGLESGRLPDYRPERATIAASNTRPRSSARRGGGRGDEAPQSQLF